MGFPATHHLPVRQGADIDRTFRWFLDAPANPNHRGTWDAATTYEADDLVIHAGATYRALVTTTGETPNTTPASWTALTPADLTGWDARLHARRKASDTATLLTLDAPASSGAGITLGGTAGTVRLQIPNSSTATLPVGSWPYDLELISPGGLVTPFLAGRLLVTREVTR